VVTGARDGAYLDFDFPRLWPYRLFNGQAVHVALLMSHLGVCFLFSSGINVKCKSI